MRAYIPAGAGQANLGYTAQAIPREVARSQETFITPEAFPSIHRCDNEADSGRGTPDAAE